MSDWVEKAINLAEQGDLSWRKIAKKIGVPKSTVSDRLRKHFSKTPLEVKSGDKGEGDEWEEWLRKTAQNKISRSVTGLTNNVKTDVITSSRGVTHLIIADTQCKPSQSLDYMLSLGEFIADKQPDVIIHIGDHYDFESLSSYDKGKRSFEGRRLKADIEAGNIGLELLTRPMRSLQERQRMEGVEVYAPRMIFTVGNHCQRLDRLVEDTPELSGMFGVDQLPIAEYGFEVYPFLKPACVDGINYVHFLANPFTGKPYGGNALNQLKNVGNSFVVGHKQTLDVAMRPTLDGKMQIGIINGSCYPFDEGYKGFQGNNHFRGVTVLHEVKDGFGLPMFVSLEYIMDKYK